MNNDLISREELKHHKFVGIKFKQIDGRTNGKTLENINKAYMQGWNDAIDAIIDNAPTVERPRANGNTTKPKIFSLHIWNVTIAVRKN